MTSNLIQKPTFDDTPLNSKKDLEQYLDDTSINRYRPLDTLHIVMFTAGWCPPCKRIKAEIEKQDGISDVYRRCLFHYIDVDQYQELKSEFGVTSIPRFFLMQNQKGEYNILDEIASSNSSSLSNLIDKYLLKNDQTSISDLDPSVTE